jgi:DNA invertase Pin-like site-specific DNA recombinase/DNA-binding CsgD family transcriptional regulator
MSLSKVAIYRRVSTMMQADDGISYENQLVMVLAELEKKLGPGRFTYEVFGDEGKSGGSGPKPWATVRKSRDRKGLFEMIQRLSKREFTHVAAYHPDRIYRDQLGFSGLYSEVMKPLGIQFIFVTGSFDTTHEGMFAQGVLAHVAELQRHQVSENIRRNLECKRKEGYYLGTVPFGWRREETHEHEGRRSNIRRLESEGDVVVRISQMYLSGMSEQAIADKLNAENVPHKKSVGKWRANTVNLVLINPTHAGLVRSVDGSLIEGLHHKERYYDETVLARIQSRLERNRKRLKGVDHTQPFRLFSGLAHCGHCGKKLQGSFHTESPGYRCLGRGTSTDGAHVYISAKSIEELVVAELASLAREPEIYDAIEQQIESLVRMQTETASKRAAEVRKCLADLLSQEDTVVEALGKKIMTPKQAERRLKDLAAQTLLLESELVEIDKILQNTDTHEQLIRGAKAVLPKFDQIWDHLTDAERREALHLTIEELKVFAKEERKWIELKLVFKEAPVEIEVLRGAERYRSGKLDGVASLTPRELACLKHAGDGANYVQIAKYFESSPTNAHALLRRAVQKLGAKNIEEAVKIALPTIRRLQSQLPLFGKIEAPKHSPKRLKVMEYQILGLAAEGNGAKEIALHTGIDLERVNLMLSSALEKVEVKGAVAAMNKLGRDDSQIPVTLVNRRRKG